MHRLSHRILQSVIWQIFFLGIIPSAGFAIQFNPAGPSLDIADSLASPSDVSVSTDGRIYVVDGVNHSVRVFLPTGKLDFAFGRQGEKDGELNSPLGIHMDGSGRVYVADSGNHRVQIFDRKGAFIAKIDLPPKNGVPADPVDVAVDETRRRCYVVDNDHHRILVYDLSSLRLVDTFGKPGAGDGEFKHPFLLSLDPEKNLLVVDVINTRVQVISPEGKYLRTIGGWGVEKGEFFRPKGVAVDARGRVYVSDSYMGVVQIFEPSGTFFAAIGDGDTRVKRFKTPTGLFMDSKNRLYVAEMFARKVSVHQIQGLE